MRIQNERHALNETHKVALSKQRSWSQFYKETAKRPPAATLGLAIWLFEAESIRQRQRFAVDLGCGAGRDTVELLRRGWKALAVDKETQAIRLTRAAAIKHHRRLRTTLASIENVRLPKCDLVNASWCLPFCSPKHFNSLWQRIIASIRPGGRFAGHFFGVHDGWITDSAMTFHTRTHVKKLLRGFEKELFLEKEWDGTTASGKKKHWHVYSVVARKL